MQGRVYSVPSLELVLLVFYGGDVFFHLKSYFELVQEVDEAEVSLVEQFLSVDVEFDKNQYEVDHFGLWSLL